MSELDERECSASRYIHFTSRLHWIESRMGFSPGLEVKRREKLLFLLEIEILIIQSTTTQ